MAPTTVSAILNDRPHCYASAQTRERVLQAAQELGYRPNLAARALSGKQTHTLGVVIPGYGVETVALMLGHIETIARSLGYVAINTVHMDQPELEDQAIIHLRERFVDGLLVYPATTGEHQELIRLVDDGVPVATLNAKGTLGELAHRISDVCVDNIYGGNLQARHMIERGCKALCLFQPRTQAQSILDRLEGVRQTVAQNADVRLTVQSLDVPRDADEHIGELAANEIDRYLRRNQNAFDGIICSNDLLALSAARSLARRNIHIPEQCALIGFDDNAFSAISPVSLSSIAQQRQVMARQALNCLLQQIQQTESRPQIQHQSVKPKLIVRESTTRQPRQLAAGL